MRHLDSEVVVVEKPAGLNTVPFVRDGEAKRFSSHDKSLVELTAQAIKKILRSSKPAHLERLHVVQRLDRDTSGLVIFARTKNAERSLGSQLRSHTTERRYLAIVQGQIASQTIRSHLVADRGDRRRGSTSDRDAGRLAITHVKCVENLAHFTLVECQLETGRTHQIRIHLSEKGHPLCGDSVYQKRLFRETRRDRIQAPRLALHATVLAFDHPVSGERLSFAMDLPEDLQEFLAKLRLETRERD